MARQSSTNKKIFKYISKVIADNSDFSVTSFTYNDMDAKSENKIGIYVSSPQVVKKRDLASGLPISKMANVRLVYHCKNSEEGIDEAEGLLEELIEVFCSTHNKIIYFYDKELSDSKNYNNYISISQIDPLTDVIDLGKNKHTIPRRSIRFRVNFKGGN